MKKLLYLVAILIILMCILDKVDAAGGSGVGYQVITSTGVTVINFSKNVTEIYVVTMTTGTAYINWTSTTPTTSNFALGQLVDTDVIEHTEEVQSSKMSVLQAIGPVHIRAQWKYWR